MINLSQYLEGDFIIPELRCKTKKEVIEALIKKAYTSEKISNGTVSEQEACAAVLQREQLQSTGIGKELAFPHARIKGWGDLTVVAAASEAGIDFSSIDGKPVKCIFLLISSPDEPYIVLQTMSAVIKEITALADEAIHAGKSVNFAEILKTFCRADIRTSKHVLAKDIAQPVDCYVTLETTLEKVTQIMHFERKSVLPVVDQNNRLCGEISSLAIFDYGMPDFFKQLNTISFVRHIDPFEKYFKLQKTLVVKDVMTTEMRPVKEDATIAEIIFELTVKKAAKLFMVNEAGQLKGVIDRFSIVDQILFF